MCVCVHEWLIERVLRFRNNNSVCVTDFSDVRVAFIHFVFTFFMFHICCCCRKPNQSMFYEIHNALKSTHLTVCVRVIYSVPNRILAELHKWICMAGRCAIQSTEMTWSGCSRTRKNPIAIALLTRVFSRQNIKVESELYLCRIKRMQSIPRSLAHFHHR